MAKKDPNAGAKLLSTDVKKAFGSVDLNPANVGYRNLRAKVKASRAAKAAAPASGAATRGGKRAEATAKAAPAAKAAPKKMAPAKAKAAPAKKAAPKAASKTSSYGNDSYSQHETFRKELEAGGGRAAWNASKQAEAGGAKVEISKPSSGTSLNAELDKFQASGGKSAKKDVKLGVVGRTGGKWHLGKKVGKG